TVLAGATRPARARLLVRAASGGGCGRPARRAARAHARLPATRSRIAARPVDPVAALAPRTRTSAPTSRPAPRPVRSRITAPSVDPAAAPRRRSRTSAPTPGPAPRPARPARPGPKAAPTAGPTRAPRPEVATPPAPRAPRLPRRPPRAQAAPPA